MIALEMAVAGSRSDLFKCSRHIGGCMGCCLGCCSPLISCFAAKKMRKQHPDVRPISEYREKLKEALAGKEYLSGDKPGIVDISLFGMLRGFVDAKNDCLDDLISDSTLSGWLTRTQAAHGK